MLNPPANIDDFRSDEQRRAWSDWLQSRFADERKDLLVETGGEPPQFFDPSEAPAAVATLDITWGGFPKQIASAHPDDARAAWTEAEDAVLDPEFGVVFRPQDEYLEWHTTKRPSDGKIIRVDFTCEGPEYWEALAHGYPLRYTGPRDPAVTGDSTRLLELYRHHVSEQVEPADLFQGDEYDRFNKWNTRLGAMHLSNVFNTLGAEINIAARATVRREKNGQELIDEDKLIRCAHYGDEKRASDPHIGGEVNGLARQGFQVSLADPVGLYLDLDAFEPAGWTKPNGDPVDDYWHVERGTRDRALRAVYEVRDEEFVVGEIKIGSDPIEFGGQIALLLTMKLTGIAHSRDSVHNTPHGCVAARAIVALAAPDPLSITTRAT